MPDDLSRELMASIGDRLHPLPYRKSRRAVQLRVTRPKQGGGSLRPCYWRLSLPALKSRHRAYRIQRARDDHPPSDLAQVGSRHGDLTPSKSEPNGYDCEDAGAIR